jgi:hypothetical protein
LPDADVINPNCLAAPLSKSIAGVGVMFYRAVGAVWSCARGHVPIAATQPVGCAAAPASGTVADVVRLDANKSASGGARAPNASALGICQWAWPVCLWQQVARPMWATTFDLFGFFLRWPAINRRWRCFNMIAGIESPTDEDPARPIAATADAHQTVSALTSSLACASKPQLAADD